MSAGSTPGDPTNLPEAIAAEPQLTVCRWTANDASALGAAVEQSREHLLPWMSFASEPPLSLEARRQQIDAWESQWAAGGDCIYGIFVEGEVAGGCGLHHRLGPDGLEIGYWLHPRFTGRGVATETARLLTDAAFTVATVRLVEIHHDEANVRSAGVPRRLGYRFLGEFPREPEAPGEVGVEVRWQTTRATWLPRLPAYSGTRAVTGGCSPATGVSRLSPIQ
jgi:RimJ/RimL family protein N-acetyltransferase